MAKGSNEHTDFLRFGDGNGVILFFNILALTDADELGGKVYEDKRHFAMSLGIILQVCSHRCGPEKAYTTRAEY